MAMNSQTRTPNNENTKKSGYKVVGNLNEIYPYSNDPTKTMDAPPFYESDTLDTKREARRHLQYHINEVIPQMFNGFNEVIELTDDAVRVENEGQTQTDYIFKVVEVE
jgi:hypothetical protein